MQVAKVHQTKVKYLYSFYIYPLCLYTKFENIFYFLSYFTLLLLFLLCKKFQDSWDKLQQFLQHDNKVLRYKNLSCIDEKRLFSVVSFECLVKRFFYE